MCIFPTLHAFFGRVALQKISMFTYIARYFYKDTEINWPHPQLDFHFNNNIVHLYFLMIYCAYFNWWQMYSEAMFK